MYKKKREQMTELQEKQKSMTITLEDYKIKLMKAEEEVKEHKVSLLMNKTKYTQVYYYGEARTHTHTQRHALSYLFHPMVAHRTQVSLYVCS